MHVKGLSYLSHNFLVCYSMYISCYEATRAVYRKHECAMIAGKMQAEVPYKLHTHRHVYVYVWKEITDGTLETTHHFLVFHFQLLQLHF